LLEICLSFRFFAGDGVAWAYVRFSRCLRSAAFSMALNRWSGDSGAGALDSGRTALKTRFLAVWSCGGRSRIFRSQPSAGSPWAGVLTGGRQWIGRKEQGSLAPLFTLLSLIAALTVLPLLLEDPSPLLRRRVESVVSDLPEVWLDRLWKRLCSPGISPHRPCRPPPLAHHDAASGCDRRRAGDSRAGIHHRNLYRVYPGRAVRSACRNGGNLSSGLCVCTDQRSASARNRKSPVAGAFLDGVNVASLP